MKKCLVLLVVCLLIGVGSAAAEYYDFGGDTIYILNQSHDPAARFVEGTTVGGARFGTAYGLHKEAEELFNCKIEFDVFGWGQYEAALMTRLLSGESENDLWVMIDMFFWPLMAQGAFFPVGDILPAEYFDSLPGIPRGIADYMSFAGSRYGFGAGGGAIAGLAAVFYRDDLIEEAGLPDPQELYNAGEWTWEAFGDLAQRFTGDTNNDGQIDRYGFSLAFHLPELLIWTNGGSLLTEVDGRMVYTGNQQAAVDTLNQLHEWRNVQQVMHPGDAGGRRDMQWLAAGQVGMSISAVGAATQSLTDTDVSYRIVPLPKGPNMDTHVYPSLFIDTAFVLPANSRHPEGMVQLVEFLYSQDDYQMITQEIIQASVRDRMSAQILWDMHDNWEGLVRQVARGGGPMTPVYNAMRDVLNQNKTAAQAMDEVAAAAQTTLDELFNQ